MRVLVVDDERNIRRALAALLESEGHRVCEAGSSEEALALIRDEGEMPDVVLLDLMLPGMSGLDALPLLREASPGTTVVMMSGRASLADAVEATRRGAFHFIEKPLAPEAVLLTVRGAGEVARARDLTRALVEELGPGTELVGRTPAIEQVRTTIRTVAPTESRVLVTGESGTGKELVATALHGLSPRSRGPFVRVNSAAIPRDLVESELFGHERGAFTGATERRRGRFELADGGTLFLDEVGDLSAEAQAKLLRVLESGEMARVGGADTFRVDVRVVAATNHDLHRAVAEGRFRRDLLYRLDVVPLHMPPLRERLDDIPLLVAHAGERLRTRQGLAPVTFSPEALARLSAYAWPGNVRELMNLVERLTILRVGDTIDAAAVAAVLPGATSAGSGGPAAPGAFIAPDERSLRVRLDDHERALIEGALTAAGHAVADAARLLKTDRANLYRRMRRLGIHPDDAS